MKMKKINSIAALVFLAFFLFGWVSSAKAEIRLIGDELIMNGFLRSQVGLNVGNKNPVLKDKLDYILLRTLLQAELSYKPIDVVNFYTKIRAINNSTEKVNNLAPGYDAYPTKFAHDWT